MIASYNFDCHRILQSNLVPDQIILEIGFLNHIASVHASHVAIYSAYIVLSATDLCFLLAHDIIAKPKLKHIPEVFLLSSAFPAQSKYVNP
jgi:hypothetical protein